MRADLSLGLGLHEGGDLLGHSPPEAHARPACVRAAAVSSTRGDLVKGEKKALVLRLGPAD
eukprot:751734-Hanusia_phi.AAC.1